MYCQLYDDIGRGKLKTTSYEQDPIGGNRWLLKEVRGATILDGLLLFVLKVIYLALMVLLRAFLGKQKRNIFCSKLGIFYFKDFLYKSIKLLRLVDVMLLKIAVPKYNYKVYCRVNKEDFVILTRHEDEIIEHFSPKKGDIVIDVGAHMGRYTIIASKRVGENGKVIAIEAHPGNYEMLNRNIKLNKLTNIIPLNFAVYSKETKVKLFLPDEDLGYTMHHTVMSERVGETGKKFVEVNAYTLDHLLYKQNGIRPEDVRWIKIDVEGAELEVLKGAADILSNSKDITLLIEVHTLDSGSLYRPVMELLGSYGFRVEFEKSYQRGEKHIIARKFL
jgi:FkbM family methyltransferase